MEKLATSLATAVGGAVVGIFLAWSLDVVSTREASIICAAFGALGAILSWFISPERLGRAFAFILRMINPP